MAVSVALLFFCALDNLTTYAQQGGAATGGNAIGGPSISGGASIVCKGTTCIYNFPGGHATGGQATGGAATSNGGNATTLPGLPKSIDKYSFVTKWGSEGTTADGQFLNPSDIAMDSSGYVYVVDTLKYRIEKFDSNGNLITKLGSKTAAEGQFNPEGIAMDSSGYVYVADFDNDRVQKFDSNGKFITKWGFNGTDDGQFKYPSGIVIDSSGYVFVVDTGNHRIQVFSPSSNP